MHRRSFLRRLTELALSPLMPSIPITTGAADGRAALGRLLNQMAREIDSARAALRVSQPSYRRCEAY